MRPGECPQTDRHTHARTDAKRFYYLSHAICYSYGADNNGQAMLTTVRCAPHELRLVIVNELQAVGLHLVSDDGDAVGDF